MPFVSIIVPVYNVQDFLDSCIHSILSQSFEDYELILVNDGSQDQSGEKCDDWANKNHKIKVFHQKNQGVSVARNTGMSMATGVYVTFIDADDTVKENWLETVYQANLLHKADIISYGMENIKDNKIFNISIAKEFCTCSKEAFFSYFDEYHQKIMGSVCLKFYKRALIEDHEVLFDVGIHINEDMFFDYKIIPFAKSILNIDQAFYQYRSRDNSGSNKGHTNIIEIFDLRQKRYQIFMEQMGYPYTQQVLQDILSNGVFTQFIQGVTTANSLSFSQRIKILNKIYRNKQYYTLLKNNPNFKGDTLSLKICKLSVWAKIPSIVIVPGMVKKYLVKGS